METKPPQTEITFGENKENPFHNDLLNRKQEIMDLTPMIKRIKSPAVMALYAPWGAGKTAFIKMWAAYLNKEQIPAFYFNAWETDFAVDPLVPFMEKITEQLPGKMRRKLMKGAKALIPALIGGVVRNFGNGWLAKITDYLTGKFFTHHGKLTEFKNTLKDFIGTQKGKRVVIFVDELDRCRPDYAIKVLERIKHLFKVPGVIFILAINREQLRHSVKALYGLDMKGADIYLRRFIEFDITIKQPDMDGFITARLKHMEIDKFLEGRKRSFGYDRQNLHETLTLLAKVYNLFPRDMEQLLMRVVLVLYALEDDEKDKQPFHPSLLAFLIVARLKMLEHYRRYILPADDGVEMVGRWEAAGIYDGAENIKIASHITAQILMAKHDTTGANDLMKSYKDKANNAPSNNARSYYNSVSGYAKNFGKDDNNRINLSRLVNKIELLDKFRFPDDGNAKGNGV